jgi:hypothetical protein
MPSNPWLALDARTRPLVRARQLRAAWERFLGEGRLEAVRAPVADSWRRSLAAGVDPLRRRGAPTLIAAEEARARWHEHPIAEAGALIRDCLGPIAVDTGNLIVVSDADGMLLWIEGPSELCLEAAESMNFTEGAEWSECGAGTNAIGTALAADHALQVFAAEHFSEVVQPWTCSAAPVHDPDTGRLLGIIDVTGKLGTVHPGIFGLALATSRAVEAQLRALMREDDARLRGRYEDRVTAAGSRALLVTPSGRVIVSGSRAAAPSGEERLTVPPGGGELMLPSGARAFAEPVGGEAAFIVRALDEHVAGGSGHRPILKLRLLGPCPPRVELDGAPLQLSRVGIEILALLSADPAGMTGQQMAADLYGEDEHPGAVRVHIFRLRKALGPWIAAAPYRLTIDVDSDVDHIRGLLERGAVREAAQGYAGPLLPYSDAPGIVRRRDDLEGWLRNAVMTADDTEALWAWVRTCSGRDDLAAWLRLLPNLDYGDPRRSLAASRVAALRNSLQPSR